MKAHGWVLPLYMWGLESSLNIIEKVLNAPIGLVSLPESYYRYWFYEVAPALFLLVLCQSVAIMLVDRPSFTLGLSGGQHLAGIAVILSVFFLSVTYFWFMQVYKTRYGIPVRLQEISMICPAP